MRSLLNVLKWFGIAFACLIAILIVGVTYGAETPQADITPTQAITPAQAVTPKSNCIEIMTRIRWYRRGPPAEGPNTAGAKGTFQVTDATTGVVVATISATSDGTDNVNPTGIFIPPGTYNYTLTMQTVGTNGRPIPPRTIKDVVVDCSTIGKISGLKGKMELRIAVFASLSAKVP